jgi:hypothetical protein
MQQKIYQDNIKNLTNLNITSNTHEGTIRSDTFSFDSFISHLVEYIEIVKTLEGIFPNLILSNVMAVLLNFRPIPMYLPKKSTYGISN